MMRKEYGSYSAFGYPVLLTHRLVNTDESILSVAKKNLLFKNGKDMLLLSVRLVVIFNNCL